ncbi:MAG: SDR family NAD(P)-dependent oxidoreductase [Gammaproteobacteria bacterium]|nr:SDR family NAD(P)-dependent oxidoreductase [Gammaproteobacteria bacterium]
MKQKLKTAIVIGVGPLNGLGAQLGVRFAQRGLRTYVAGRTQANVDAVASFIRDQGHDAIGVATDARDSRSISSLFDVATANENELTLAIYNVGNNTPGRLSEMDPDYFEASWRTCCFGGFLFAQAAVNRMSPIGGTVLFTGASASMRGRANFGAFNSGKGALRLMAQALSKECGPDGIHVGHVVIDGPIGGDKIIKGIPQYAEQVGEAGLIDLQGIVDAYEYLYDQPRRAWTFEVDVRTSIEKW